MTSPIAYLLLSPTTIHVLDRVASDVFDHAVDVAWAKRFLDESNHHMIVAIDDGEVVGMISAVDYVHPDKAPQLWINEVGVAPSHQRRGIGRELMKAMLEHGRTLSCTEAWLGTEHDNLPARALYESLGSTAEPFVMYAYRLGDSVRNSANLNRGATTPSTNVDTPSMSNFAIEHGIEVLERTPAALRAMLYGLSDEWLRATEGPETWSPFDVVGHLVHGERTDWITRARIIIAQGDDRTFAPFDRFAQFRESEGKSMGDLLNEFEQLRHGNLATLREWNVSHPQLALTGVHPAFGTVTLRQLLSTWVAHDLGHIAQVARVMAKQYRDDVGPWREYLSIMDR